MAFSLPATSLPAALLAVALLASPAAAGASRVAVTAASLEVAGQRIEGVELALSLRQQAVAGLRLRARSLPAMTPAGRLRELDLQCDRLVTAPRLQCRDGWLSGLLGPLGRQRLAVSLDWNPADGRAIGGIARLALAGGEAAANIDVVVEGTELRRWQVDGSGRGLQAEGLATLARPWLALPEGFSLAGTLAMQARAAGSGGVPRSVHLQVDGAGIGFADASGAAAAEQLQPTVTLHATHAAARAGWQFAADLGLPAGQVYFEPVFLDFGQHGLAARAAGSVDAGFGAATLDTLEVGHAGVLAARGSATLLLATPEPLPPARHLQRLRLELTALDLGQALPAYVQPALVGTPFKDLAGEGRMSGWIDVDDGLPSRLDLVLDGITLDSPAGALGIQGVAGRVRWYDEDKRLELAQAAQAEFGSEVSWQSGRLWGMELGASQARFATTSRHFRLTEPAFLPLFDGGLAIETLRVRHAGLPEMYVRLDAALQPISIALIGRALGWPEFGGTLSGTIPRLTLEHDAVTLGGNVEAQVFDGRVTVRNLRLKDPLGQFPQLAADIDIAALDLEQITSAFSFGRITGRLSGEVQGLQTFDWSPLAFDARLYSTPGDRTRRKISQRAVANLSSIGGGSGGGVATALQSGFLQFFDEFSYKRLGLSCRLANDICIVDGIAPAGGGGYYIVQGSGLPRIDVIGSQRRVAWSRLLQQLMAATDTAGVVVQ